MTKSHVISIVGIFFFPRFYKLVFDSFFYESVVDFLNKWWTQVICLLWNTMCQQKLWQRTTIVFELVTLNRFLFTTQSAFCQTTTYLFPVDIAAVVCIKKEGHFWCSTMVVNSLLQSLGFFSDLKHKNKDITLLGCKRDKNWLNVCPHNPLDCLCLGVAWSNNRAVLIWHSLCNVVLSCI